MFEYGIIIVLICFIVGIAILCAIKWKSLSMKIRAANERADRIIQEANRSSETIIKEAEVESKSILFAKKSEITP